MGSLLDLALRAGMVEREIATTPAERSEPGEVLGGERAAERLLIELQPFYKWDPEELTMLRSWSREDARAVVRSLEQSRELATPEQTQALLDDCDRLIEELTELTGNHELADELRKERKKDSLCGLLEARERLREAVVRAMDQGKLLKTGMAQDDGGKTED